MPNNSGANRYGWLRQYIGVIIRLDDELVDSLYVGRMLRAFLINLSHCRNQLNWLRVEIEAVENELRWCQRSIEELGEDDYNEAVEKLQDFKFEVATRSARSRHLLKFLRSYEVLADDQKRSEPPT
ncbi:hypothetical protein M513_10956 [Trichuris suis]|uniref:Uncharacterized protein n=1 Tax=Trichuris suis TaxID=68888 RepID=A0A085LT74_9BILA|nr:hypothetical protein M513_10956 [Trichuris suis]